ncbi:CHAT domain-containing protein [Streptomyces vilmorinianum]|uniref:CHAT domain-containing protein n=1 Tax=Streptomyces vilmorinianum TaxID=3051092 RepID=UPI0010FB8C6B|nr:CHAT domain-containing protein [Streptomyces vilmorinianum]
MTAEETANRILERVVQAEENPDALRWFLSEEAARVADEVRRAGILPDGNVLLVTVHAIGWYEWCRYLAGDAKDLAALGSAVLCFFDVHRAGPELVPPDLRPIVTILAGEPSGADTDPGHAYQAGAGILMVYQRDRHPAALPAAVVLLRHSVAGFPAGSADQGTCLSDLGLALLHGAREGAGDAVLTEAVELSRASVAAVPGDRAEQVRRHGNLGLVLTHWANAMSDPAAARESVAELRRATGSSEPEDPHHDLFHAQLGSSLFSAAVRHDDPALLPEAVRILRAAVAAASRSGQQLAAYLSDLGTALIALALAPESAPLPAASADDRTALYDEGVDTCRRAADMAPNPFERAAYLTNLAFVLNGRTLRTGSTDALEAAESAARDAVAVAPPGHPTHTHAQYILSEVLRTRYVTTGSLDQLEAAIEHARSALAATGHDDHQRVIRGADLADLLRMHADAVGAPDALAEPVALLRDLAARTPPDSPRRAGILLKLARTLDAVGHGTGDAAAQASDEAVRTFRECLTLRSPSEGHEASVRYALGMALARRAVRAEADGTATPQAPDAPDAPDTPSGVHHERDEGITLIRQALDLLDEDDPRRSEYLSGYGCVHLERAAATVDPAEYAEAVRLLRQSVASAAHSGAHDLAVSSSNLGAALSGLATLTADEEQLAEGVQAHRTAVAATRPDDHYRAHRLANLGDALQRLAQQRADAGLIEEAVDVLREAARASGPTVTGTADHLTRLGNALRSLARFTGDGTPLEEAVHWHREAVAAARGTDATVTGTHGAGEQRTSESRALVNLANVLVDRYHRTHDESLRDEALDHYRAAMEAAHAPGDRHVVLTSYGYALWGRAADTGDDVLMDTAIGVLREAAATVPARHAGRGGVLTNLGAALMQRSRVTGDRTWLTEAVTVLRRAVDESPPSSFERAGLLSNLAEALRVRFEITGERAVADEAAELLREAIAFEGGERHGRDMARVNLGVLLHSVALSGQVPGLSGDVDAGALVESRRVLEEAVASLDEHHPRRTVALMNLAAICMAAADLIDDAGPAVRSSLDRAVAAAREALDRIPEGNPDQAHTQWVLARSHAARALLGEPTDLAEATRLARQAAHSRVASVSVRLNAARVWGDAAAVAGRDDEALAGYTYAVGLLPRLAPRSLGRADQEARLGFGMGLASDAAALALRRGDPEAALTLLEQGRGVLLAQGLESRGDLTRLRAADPALAAEFERVRDALSAGAPRPAAIRTDMDAPGPAQSEHEAGLLAESRHALARTWDELLDRIRRLPGLEGFLSAPRVSELLTAASAGPVVVVNVSRYRSDALLVTADEGIQVVPLPALTPDEALTRATGFVVAVDEAYGEQGAGQAVVAMRTLSDTLEWLWDSVAAPVLDRLGLRTVPIDDEPWTRLWWCPTGWLSFLPLHAAGRPHPRSAENVMDRAVSSYTPTLRALVRARQAPATAATHPAPLVVTLAETPGAAPLPGASREAKLLRELFPAQVELAGAAATVDAVRRALPAHPWVHFSCHGVSDPLNPSESGLILHDGRLTALDAATQRPSEAVLAVLSACSTSQGGFMLPDESVHLVSSFQLAGYPHVIGTLWPVSDKVATRLTEKLYGALAEDLAQGRAIAPATALHRPVRALRRRLVSAPHLWAAHIHTGP